MTVLVSLSIVCFIMFIGEFISIKSNGKIPQMLVVTICFLIGFWTILPSTILETSAIMTLSKIIFGIILIDVGTTLNLADILKQKQIVFFSFLSVLTISVSTLLIGYIFFNSTISLYAIPPLTGAGIGAMLMNTFSIAQNKPYYGAIAMSIFVCHTFISFPFATFILKKEASRQLKNFSKTSPQSSRTPLADSTNTRYQTPTFYLTLLLLLGAGIEIISIKFTINSALLQLFTGLLFNHFGFIRKNPLSKTASSGLLTLALFASFMNSFATLPFLELLKILTIVLPLTIGALLSLLLLAKCMASKTTPWSMIVAIGINSFLGFPFNFVLTSEAITSVTNEGKEQEFLMEKMLPKMILASTFSVSLLTPILASLCMELLA